MLRRLLCAWNAASTNPLSWRVCLHGSASVGIALYPEDGATKDSLLSAADAAMYAAKNAKRQIGTSPASLSIHDLTRIAINRKRPGLRRAS